MRAQRLHFAFAALAIFLSVITEVSAQNYVKTFTFKFPESSFSLEKDEGGNYILPDEAQYNWAYGEDTSKPALPYINYHILLPDNFKMKSFTFSTGDTWFATDVTLISIPTEAPTSTAETKTEEQSPYPLVKYSAEAICISEGISDGYRIANFCINPFTYHANNRKLALATFSKLTITIEPIEGEKVKHTGSMTNIVKSVVINPEDMDKGTEKWEKEFSTQCTVGNIEVDEWSMIDNLYTKDWHIRFANPEHLDKTVHAGIVADSVHNGLVYQTIVKNEDGEVTDTLLYRQEGSKIYRYSATGEKDLLLFDFSLSLGDSFIGPDGQVWTVDEVSETKAYGSRLERSLILKGKEDGELKDIWIEHVGSLYTGIFMQADFETNAQTKLIYCRQADDYHPWLFDVNTEYYKATCFQNSNPETEEDKVLFDKIGYNEQLFADLIGDTLRLYGKIYMNCYTYMLECHVQDGTIKLNCVHIYHGPEMDCLSGYWVDIRIPDFPQGKYEIRYTPWNGGEEISLGTADGISTIKMESTAFQSQTNTLTCTSSDASLLEVYTLDAVKVGQSSFHNGEAVVTVSKIPATCLYIVTYPDGRRESGKVMVK